VNGVTVRTALKMVTPVTITMSQPFLPVGLDHVLASFAGFGLCSRESYDGGRVAA
jgi:hypothetical protein